MTNPQIIPPQPITPNSYFIAKVKLSTHECVHSTEYSK